MNKLLLLFLASVYGVTWGQTPADYLKASGNIQSTVAPNWQTSVVRPFDNRFTGVKGVATLFDEYMPGEIVMLDGKTYKYPKMNYDSYEDQLLVIYNNQESIVGANVVKQFTLQTQQGNPVLFIKLIEADQSQSYYQKIVEVQGLTILKKHSKKISKPSSQETFSTGKTYSEFISSHKLFFTKGNAQHVEVKNKKALVQLFSEIKEPLEKFMKEEKTNLKEDADLIKLANFIAEQTQSK